MVAFQGHHLCVHDLGGQHRAVGCCLCCAAPCAAIRPRKGGAHAVLVLRSSAPPAAPPCSDIHRSSERACRNTCCKFTCLAVPAKLRLGLHTQIGVLLFWLLSCWMHALLQLLPELVTALMSSCFHGLMRPVRLRALPAVAAHITHQNDRLCMGTQEAPVLVVGSSTGSVKVLRLTGSLSQIDGVDKEAQAQLFNAAAEANISSAKAGAM